VRVLREVLPEVLVEGREPIAFSWRGDRLRVVDVVGRWRIEGRWWDDGHDREYWRIEVSPTHEIWDLYHDLKSDTWYVEKLWD
jgi:uncharacterized protein DUF6504